MYLLEAARRAFVSLYGSHLLIALLFFLVVALAEVTGPILRFLLGTPSFSCLIITHLELLRRNLLGYVSGSELVKRCAVRETIIADALNNYSNKITVIYEKRSYSRQLTLTILFKINLVDPFLSSLVRIVRHSLRSTSCQLRIGIFEWPWLRSLNLLQFLILLEFECVVHLDSCGDL